MDLLILAIRWIGLSGALLLTLVVLKEVALVVGTLRDIRRLADATRSAAAGLERNLGAAGQLEGLPPLAGALGEAVQELSAAAAGLAGRIPGLAPPGRSS